MNLADPTLSTQSSMRGRGNESSLVTLFTFLRSVQNLDVRSGFGISRQGELHALELGMAKPFSNKYSTSFFEEGALVGFDVVCMLFYGQAVTDINIIQNSSAGGSVGEQSGVTVNKFNNVSLGGTIQMLQKNRWIY